MLKSSKIVILFSAILLMVQLVNSQNITSKNYERIKDSLLEIYPSYIGADFESYDGKPPIKLLEKLYAYEKNNNLAEGNLEVLLLLNSSYFYNNKYNENLRTSAILLNDPAIKETFFEIHLLVGRYSDFTSLGNYAGAIETLQNLGELARRIDYEPFNKQLLIKRWQAEVLYNAGYYEEAASQFKEVINLELETFKEGPTVLAVLYNDLASCYRNLSERDSTLKYYDRALELIPANRQLEPKFSRDYQEYIVNLIKLQEYASAQNKDSLVQAEKIGLEFLPQAERWKEGNTLVAHFYLANIYNRLKDYETALRHSNEFFKLVETNFNEKKIKSLLLLTGRIHQKLDNEVKADQFFDRERKFTDSLNLLRRKSEIIRVNQRMKVEELELTNKHNETLLNQQKSYNSIFLVVAVVLLILSCVVILVAYRLKTNQKKLRVAKINADKKVVENEVLLREVHHRVKNNLHIITSMLYLKSKQTHSEEIKKVLAQSQSHVQSMALVHEMLYKDSEMNDISISEYIKTLSANLQTTFERGDVQIEIAPTDLTLALEKSIPLGLILNELFVNSFKYAFDDSSNKKHIFISLKELPGKKIRLIFSDSGSGFDFQKHLKERKTLGVRLITMLAEELNAEYHYQNEENSEYTLIFPVK